jgi:phage-related protein
MAVGRAEILVVADAAEFDRQMRKADQAARRTFGGLRREADAASRSVNGTDASVRRLAASLSGLSASMRRTASDTKSWRDENGRLRDENGRFLAEARRGFAGIDLSFKGLLGSLGGVVGLMGKVTAGGLGIGAIAGGLGAATASAIQFAAALAPAVGIVAAAPAAIGLLAGAVAVLSVALSGVGDAFSAAVSGDAEAFNESLEGLAPNAQAAAIALREITPQFTALRESVQGAFFEGFDATLRSIAATLVGPLTEGMTAVAAGLAGVTTRLGEAVTSGAGVAFIQSTFAALANVLANLQEPVGLLVEAFLSLGSTINIAFGGAEAGAALGALIERFAEFINTAADSGAAIGWVEGAITVFSQLGAIVGSVIGIIGTIGEVASRTGGNILGAFGAALESVNSFLASAEGMSTLVSIFTTLNAVGQAFGTIIAGLLPIIAPLIGTLVSGLMPVLEALTPLLLEIAAAAAPIFTQILDAVLPLIPPLVQIAQQILPLLATLFAAVVAAVAPLLEVLVTLLVTVLEPLLPALMPLIELFGELVGMLASALVPILQLLGEILLWVVNEIIIPFVIPIVEFLMELLGTALVQAVEGLGTVFEAVIDAIVAAATWLGEKWSQQAELMRLVFQLLQDKLRAGYNFIKSNVIDPLRQAFSGVRDLFDGVVAAITGDWDTAVSKLKSGVTKIKDAVSDMWEPLWTGFRSAINSVINGWNGLSFTVPEVNIPGIGSVGGFTISTPNIPTLQTSGFSFGEGLVNLHPNEAIVNAKDRRGLNMLATALELAGARDRGGIVVERGAIVIEFHGATPDPERARRIGQAAGDGLMRTLATRGAQLAVRRF